MRSITRPARLLTTAIALAACAPLLSACTLTIGEGDKKADAPAASGSPAASATSAAASTPAAPTSSAASSEATTSAPDAASNPSDSAPASPTQAQGGSAQADPPGTKRQRVDVPAGHGIQSLELLNLYGGDTSSGKFGHAIGVFDVTNDRPMLINLRVQLFDAAGKEVANDTGLNGLYTVGSHRLVTRNLIQLPTGATPKTFKVSIVDTTPISDTTITSFERPRIGTKNGVPALIGSFTVKGSTSNTIDAKGACVMPDGKLVEGQETISDNPMTAAGDAKTGTYEIPFYDLPKGADLSRAACSASA